MPKVNKKKKPTTSTIVKVESPNTDDLEKVNTAIERRASEIVVANDVDYEAAGDFLATLREAKDAVNSRLAEPVRKAYEAHRALKGLQNDLLKPIERAEQVVKLTMGAYVQERQRREDEERRQREEEARREQEKARQQEMKKLRQSGHVEEARQLKKEPLPTPVIETKAPPLQGPPPRKQWQWRLINVNVVPREFLKLDEAKIGQYVRAMKETADIPGIEVYSTTTVAHTRRS